MNRQHLNVRTQQTGFTLLELMVAMTIGLLLLGVTVVLLVTSASLRKNVVNNIQLQEESYFISHVLKQQLSQVGYRSIDKDRIADRILPMKSIADKFPLVEGEWAEGQTMKFVGKKLSYRFDGSSDLDGIADGSIFDCFGRVVGAGTVLATDLSIKDNELVCEIGADSVVLIGNEQRVIVEDLAYQLGIDDDGDNTLDRLVSSEASEGDYRLAKHLELKLLFASKDEIPNSQQTYWFNGTSYTSTDNRVRTETIVSVSIRN